VDLLRYLLETLLILAGAIVWLGVYLEGERFSQKTKEKGWQLLLYGLGAETVLAVLVLLVDAEITRRQHVAIAQLSDENIELQSAIAPRAITSTQLQELAADWARFSGRRVSVSVVGYDNEAAGLTEQILSALRAAHVEVKDHTVDGAFEIADLRHLSGITVRGTDRAFVRAVMGDLRSIGLLVVESTSPPEIDSDAAVRMFVGRKPLPTLIAPAAPSD